MKIIGPQDHYGVDNVIVVVYFNDLSHNNDTAYGHFDGYREKAVAYRKHYVALMLTKLKLF